MVRPALILLGLAAALVIALWYSQQAGEAVRVSGFVEADEIRLGSRVGGRVARVHVEEGQRVEAGQVLVQLEPFELREALAEAQARVAQAVAARERLRAGYRAEEIAQARAHFDQRQAIYDKLKAGPRPQELESARAAVRLAEAEQELALSQQTRAESLMAQKAISREDFDAANTRLQVVRSRLQQAAAELALLEEGTRQEDLHAAAADLAEAQAALDMAVHGFRAEDLAQAEAAADAALAAEQTVRRRLDELQIAAPVDGWVEALELQPGDLVPGNAAVISMMDESQLWVRCYVPQRFLELQIGDELPITIDSFPQTRFTGRIVFIARQAEFTPGNVQTPEERGRQVFRVKVLIQGDHPELRPGMSADVWLESGARHG